MGIKKEETQKLQELKTLGVERFKQALYGSFDKEYALYFPTKQDDFGPGYAYFPINPLAGVYRVVPYREHWMMERNGAGRYILESEINHALIETDEEGTITQTQISYLLPEQFSDEDWLKWEGYEDWVHEGFDPYDGYCWYYRGNNIDMFPEIPGYPTNWWEIAKESFKDYIQYKEEISAKQGYEVKSIYNEDER